ncbi:DUF1476 domain-containing protein [Breoghania sp.]|uniref:DUF1476 domain-containing protein n=1 Tax=Breoghania sp. TaxID=2065378 RepID=UPI003204D765
MQGVVYAAVKDHIYMQDAVTVTAFTGNRSRPVSGQEKTMSTFNKREDAFENRYVNDEEMQFKAMARRNRLLGQWAAEKMGVTGEEAVEYAKTVVRADLEEPGEEDVFRKIRSDFDAAKVEQSDHQIRRTMEELMSEAIAQVKGES